MKNHALLLIAPLSLMVPLTLTGCGGGSNGGAVTAPLALTQYVGTIPLTTGQTGAFSVTTQPSGAAAGTVTVTNLAEAAAAPARPSDFLMVGLTPGTYPVTGTINAATGAYSLTSNIPPVGAVAVTGTLPTTAAAGTYALSLAGTASGSGTLPAGAFTVSRSFSF